MATEEQRISSAARLAANVAQMEMAHAEELAIGRGVAELVPQIGPGPELAIVREGALELPTVLAAELVIVQEAARAPSPPTARVAGRTLAPVAEMRGANRATGHPLARVVAAAARARSVTAASPRAAGAGMPSAAVDIAEALPGPPAAGEVVAWAAAV